MAATAEGTFKLIDRASGTLDTITRKALKADEMLKRMGGTLDKLDGKLTATGDRVDDLSAKLEVLSGIKATPKVELDGAAKTIAELKAVQHEMDKTDKKARAATGGAGAGGGRGIFMSGLFAGGAGIKAMFTGISKWITLAPLALGAIVDLSGAVVALGSSATAAVGGAGLIGGAGLSGLAAGMGSIFAIGKTALSPLKAYNAALVALNKAMASGDPRAIAKAQQTVDNLAKQSPGIARLSKNLTGVKDEWKKLSAPGQRSFLGMLSDGLDTVRKKLPLFAKEANKNAGAARKGFKTVLSVFDTKTFDSFFKTINRDFRKSLGPLSKGFRDIGLGVMRLFKLASPETVKMSKSFAAMAKHFREWSGTPKAKKFVDDMVKSFHVWGGLLKSTVRLLKALFAPARDSGNSMVASLTKTFDKWTEWLNKHPKTMRDFFHRSVEDTIDLAKALGKLVENLWNIGKATRPLVGIMSSLVVALGGLPSIMGGGGVEDAALGFLGGKVGYKAFKAWRKSRGTGAGGMGGAGGGGGGILNRLKNLTGNYGTLTGVLGEGIGSHHNPIAVVSATGFGGPGGGKGEPGGGDKKVTPFGRVKNFLKGPGAGLGTGIAAESAAAGGLGLGSTALLAAGPLAVIGALMLTNNHNFSKRDINRQSAARARYRGRAIGMPTGGSGPFAAGATPTLPTSALGREGGAGIAAATAAGSGKLANLVGGGLSAVEHLFDHSGKRVSKLWGNTLDNVNSKAGTSLDKTGKGVDDKLGKVQDSFNSRLKKMQAVVTTTFSAIYAEMTGWLGKVVGSGVSNVVGGVTSAVTGSAKGNKKKGAKGLRIPGFGQSDTVPIAPGAMAAPGELIVNKHTENRVDRLLRTHGTSLGREVAGETVPHSTDLYAKGGRSPHYAGPTGQGVGSGKRSGGANLYGHPGNIAPALSRLIGIMERKFPGLLVTATRDGNHVSGSDHYTGHAVDMASGDYGYMDKAAAWINNSGLFRSLKQGIHNPNLSVNRGRHVPSSFYSAVWAGHRNHIHLAVEGALRAFSGGAGAGAGMTHTMARRLLKGIGGVAGRYGQGALDKVRGAAQARLDAAGGGGGGSTYHGPLDRDFGRGSKVQLSPSQVAMIANSVGLPGRTFAQIAHGESNYQPGAVSPDGGFGLWQITPRVHSPALRARWKQIGSFFNPVKNAMMAKVLYDQAGHTISPWHGTRYVNRPAVGTHALGGRVAEWGGWHGDGLNKTFDRPTYIGVGEKGKEHVKITPGGSDGGGIVVHKLVVYGNEDTKREVKRAFHELSRELDLQAVEGV